MLAAKEVAASLRSITRLIRVSYIRVNVIKNAS
jgi:hypothetical protein